MNSVKHFERIAVPLTSLLCVLSLMGLWALMTGAAKVPPRNPALLAAVHHSKNVVSYRAPRSAKPLSSAHASVKLPAWLPKGEDLMVDPALLLAIIKQESNFKPTARSAAGASGLMQIMPATAEYIIKLYRLNEIKVAALEMPRLPKPISANRLHNPQVNLTIGQHYLKYLAEKSYIEGNLIYMLAAYNAGPGNLITWQKRFAGVHDPREFMRRIPFKETRHYVQKVLRDTIAYQKRLGGGRSQVEDALRQGVWPIL